MLTLLCLCLISPSFACIGGLSRSSSKCCPPTSSSCQTPCGGSHSGGGGYAAPPQAYQTAPQQYSGIPPPPPPPPAPGQYGSGQPSYGLPPVGVPFSTPLQGPSQDFGAAPIQTPLIQLPPPSQSEPVYLPSNGKTPVGYGNNQPKIQIQSIPPVKPIPFYGELNTKSQGSNYAKYSEAALVEQWTQQLGAPLGSVVNQEQQPNNARAGGYAQQNTISSSNSVGPTQSETFSNADYQNTNNQVAQPEQGFTENVKDRNYDVIQEQQPEQESFTSEATQNANFEPQQFSFEEIKDNVPAVQTEEYTVEPAQVVEPVKSPQYSVSIQPSAPESDSAPEHFDSFQESVDYPSAETFQVPEPQINPEQQNKFEPNEQTSTNQENQWTTETTSQSEFEAAGAIYDEIGDNFEPAIEISEPTTSDVKFETVPESTNQFNSAETLISNVAEIPNLPNEYTQSGTLDWSKISIENQKATTEQTRSTILGVSTSAPTQAPTPSVEEFVQPQDTFSSPDAFDDSEEQMANNIQPAVVWESVPNNAPETDNFDEQGFDYAEIEDSFEAAPTSVEQETPAPRQLNNQEPFENSVPTVTEENTFEAPPLLVPTEIEQYVAPIQEASSKFESPAATERKYEGTPSFTGSKSAEDDGSSTGQSEAIPESVEFAEPMEPIVSPPLEPAGAEEIVSESLGSDYTGFDEDRTDVPSTTNPVSIGTTPYACAAGDSNCEKLTDCAENDPTCILEETEQEIIPPQETNDGGFNYDEYPDNPQLIVNSESENLAEVEIPYAGKKAAGTRQFVSAPIDQSYFLERMLRRRRQQM